MNGSIELLSDGISVRQRDFVKGLAVTFPLVYCGFDVANGAFLTWDVLTRCMWVAAIGVLLNCLSLLWLWVIHRLSGRRMWGGVVYYVGPVVVVALFGCGRLANFENDPAAVMHDVLRCHFYFFAPFVLYAAAAFTLQMFLKKRKDMPRPLSREDTDEVAGEGAQAPDGREA